MSGLPAPWNRLAPCRAAAARTSVQPERASAHKRTVHRSLGLRDLHHQRQERKMGIFT